MSEFAEQLMDALNIYRENHGSPALTLSEGLCEKAKKWAEHMASEGKLSNANEQGIGQTLAWSSGYISTQKVADMWYNEIKGYKFSRPRFTPGTGGFTQVVWRSTTDFGAAVAYDSNGGLYIVGQYSPQGNITNPGYFEENVKPLGTKVTPLPKPIGEAEFIQQMLDALNIYRSKHGSHALTLSTGLCEDAKKWAINLTSLGKLQNSTANERGATGESLAWSSGTMTSQEVVDMWYNESKDYNFSKPGFTPATGSFTQAVWRSTSEFGAAIVYDSYGASYVVARYSPQGNISCEGFFEENVKPLGTKVQPLPKPIGNEEKEFIQQLLDAHNIYRAKHGSPALKMSAGLCEGAKIWAEHMASEGELLKAKEQGIGQNLTWSSGYISAQKVADMWYNEIKNYDFSKPGFSPSCGSFTQVVWRSTTEFGAAVSYDSNGASYIVGRYSPQGNVTNRGWFEYNVKQPL